MVLTVWLCIWYMQIPSVMLSHSESKDASDLMSNAPDIVDEKQLEELCIKVDEKEVKKKQKKLQKK